MKEECIKEAGFKSVSYILDIGKMGEWDVLLVAAVHTHTHTHTNAHTSEFFNFLRY
jgi:predicted membrane-bound spermidine synthase